MRYALLGFLWMALACSAGAQQIERGTLKKLDLPGKKIVVTQEGRDIELALNDRTNVLGASGKNLAEKLKDFREGSEIFYRAGKQEGQEVALGLKRVEPGDPPRRPREDGAPVVADTSHLKPLNELGEGKYQGFSGGLYPDGKNERPREHEAAGLKLAAQVQPLNAEGQPDPNGKIVLLSVGMSNTSQSSQGFSQSLALAKGKNPKLLFVNGAQGGMTAAAIQSLEERRGAQYWAEVDNRLKQAGVSREQVQAVWIKQADAGPSQGFPKYAQTLEEELGRIVRLIAERFPNAHLCYLSSRTYGGYATTRLNPEPYAYESAFAVKWLIEKQIRGEADLNYDPARGPVKSPWLSWGPYLWANGETKRDDGFSYARDDFVGDGTHQSPSGQRKVGKLLLDFFTSDATTKSWFLAP